MHQGTFLIRRALWLSSKLTHYLLATIFGKYLQRNRDVIPKVSINIIHQEIIFTNHMFHAYLGSGHLDQQYPVRNDLHEQ